MPSRPESGDRRPWQIPGPSRYARLMGSQPSHRRLILAVESVVGLIRLPEADVLKNAANLSGGSDRDRRRLVELRAVPIHRGEREYVGREFGQRTVASTRSEQKRPRHAEAGIGSVVGNTPPREQERVLPELDETAA